MSKAEELARIADEARRCGSCPLCRGAKNRVSGEGDPDSEVVFVGEAPGRREDESGRPFVGSAGKLLDGLLSDAGLARGRVYITNIVECRPPGNRRPTKVEVEACSRHLDGILKVIKPKIIAPMGNSAVSHLFQKFDVYPEVIGYAHGKSYKIQVEWGEVVLFPLFHPAAAIYRRKLLPELRADMVALGALLEK